MSDIRVETLTVGWLQVPRSHDGLPKALDWMPGPLRQVAVLADRRSRGAPIPINVYLVRTGEHTLLVDTGEVPEAVDPAYFDDDPSLKLAQRLGFATMDLPAQRSLVAQLANHGLGPSDVTHVALSHLHFDHAGTMAPFESAEILVSEAEVKAQTGFFREGAHVAAWPSWFPERATRVSYTDGPLGPFDASQVVAGDERLRLVPTPGHTAGHQSLVVTEDDACYVFAGDASYSLEQLMEGTIPGMTNHPRAARRSNDRLRELIDEGRAAYLPAHDPDSAARAEALQSREP